MITRILKIPKNKTFFLFGPRQTGKTTLLKDLFSPAEALTYNLLEMDTFRRLRARPEMFREEVRLAVQKKKVSHVIVDEVQRAPDLLNEVHNLMESSLPVNFALSGSSARKLKREQANMLGGRAFTYHLDPFTWEEMGESFNLEQVLHLGSLPPVHLAESDSDRREILRSYVNTYIREEIEVEANLRSLDSFLRFLPIAAAQNGEVLNSANVARDVGVHSKTVREYYKILEDTLLGFFLLPYGKSIRKKMVKHPKFYFFDRGLVTALTNKLKAPPFPASFEYGNAFEHFLICELTRLNNIKKLDLLFSFYRTEKGAEVDCVIETPMGKTIALEIKSTDSPNPAHFKGLYSFKKVVPKAQLILAANVPRPWQKGDVLVLPWRDALKHIEDSL